MQPRMRGWFPRRCAVEAVDHYDSCQVCPLSPVLLSSLILQDISGWEEERQLQGGQSSNSKEKQGDEEEEMRGGVKRISPTHLLLNHSNPCMVTKLSFILISIWWQPAYVLEKNSDQKHRLTEILLLPVINIMAYFEITYCPAHSPWLTSHALSGNEKA